MAREPDRSPAIGVAQNSIKTLAEDRLHTAEAQVRASRNILGELLCSDVLRTLASEALGFSGARRVVTSHVARGQQWNDALHLMVDSTGKPQPLPARAQSASYATFRQLSSERKTLSWKAEQLSVPQVEAFQELCGRDVPTLLALPIFRTGGRVGGSLLIFGDSPPGEGLLRALELLCESASVAIGNALKYTNAKRDQDRLFLFADATDEALWDWNVETGELWWSGGFFNLMRAGNASVEPTVAWKLSRVHPKDSARIGESLASALNSDQPSWREEYRFQRADGTWAVVEDRGYFHRDAKARAFRMAGSLRDITELRAAEEERRRLLEQTTEALCTRDEFLSVASHELKSPLHSLQLQLHLLAAQAPKLVKDEEAAKLLAKVVDTLRRQGKRMHQLVEGLLDVTRIMGGQLHFDLEEVDASAVTNALVQTLRNEGELQRAHTEFRLDIHPGVVGHWDRMRLEQVVTNLLSNALKYGGGNPVDVLLRTEGDAAVLEVIDRGIGVAPQDHERVFGRFERAVSGRMIAGLGLGLFIVRQIVEGMQGSISLSSRLGEGSTFTMKLPLRPVSANAA